MAVSGMYVSMHLSMVSLPNKIFKRVHISYIKQTCTNKEMIISMKTIERELVFRYKSVVGTKLAVQELELVVWLIVVRERMKEFHMTEQLT